MIEWPHINKIVSVLTTKEKEWKLCQLKEVQKIKILKIILI